MPTPSRLSRRLLAVAAAATLAASLSGCSIIDRIIDKPVTRDAETEEVVEGGTASVFAIKVGDCVNDGSTGEEVFEVEAVPCAEPHDLEAYHEFSLDGSEYPGDDEIAQQADTGCYDQYAGFVGMSYEDSTLDYFPYTPTEASWTEDGDRLVSCMIGDPEGRTTGSLAGVAH
jgi:hypothetical protein